MMGSMRIETVQPLFSFLEGGLFIHQANALLSPDDRRHWQEKKAVEDLFLGPEFESLHDRQVLHLLAAAVSRLVGNLPHIAADEDFRVHQTILALYRGFCRSFLKIFPHQPQEQTLLLKWFLDRIVEKHLCQTPPIEYSALNRERWRFLIDAGEKLLEDQFPVVPPEFAARIPAPFGAHSDFAWLEEAAEQLRFELEGHDDFLDLERFGRASRSGRTLAWRSSCRQFEPAW
jgi:hypothetical protein